MKTYRILAISCLLFSLLFYNCSIPADDEEGESERDDYSCELPWKGETDKFALTSNEGIRLHDPQEGAGTAFLTFSSTTVRDTRWEFGARLTFNPSANNYARFYLASSSEILPGTADGYFIQIGGAKDNVALYRQESGKSILLASGRELMKGNNSPKLHIKVECDKNGYWTFWTRLESENEYIKEKQVRDIHFNNSVCCGIFCVYTKTRCDGITFHHIGTSNGVETSNGSGETPEEPETPTLPEYPEEVDGMLLFNEVMYNNASDGTEYIEFYNPTDRAVCVPALKILRYTDDGTTTTAILQSPDKNRGLNFPPHGYICFTKAATILIRKHKVENTKTIIELSNFLQISNDGGYLAIATDEEKPRLIDKCSYLDRMHTDKKGKQGISLEKISPELSSSKNSNWHSSINVTGGTPGIKNGE